jgi:hypothetical protein
MEAVYLMDLWKVPSRVKNVQKLDCAKVRLTRDRYMDLSLHINDVENITLDDAMYEFTKTELLTKCC